ncbi:hypothetical protein BV25DRAFT_1821654 [Artomyces pyxidatus]|uniref:Uncharacterized protein n=1 Tax=Artomyces pyxidatus TaxID=48021 RepID=A0ACB8TD23_9AGAM|nr:hypothetical protein BV25DRAFT_1821654 [Artomyces pyxidatus]
MANGIIARGPPAHILTSAILYELHVQPSSREVPSLRILTALRFHLGLSLSRGTALTREVYDMIRSVYGNPHLLGDIKLCLSTVGHPGRTLQHKDFSL